MRPEEKVTLWIALFLVTAMMVPFLLMARDIDAMKACEVEFSHDVCVHTLR